LAEGCYWASTFNIFVADFSNPTNLPYPGFDLNLFLNYDNYEDIDFVSWDDNDNFVIKCYDCKTEKYVTNVIEKDVYIHQIKKG
jgi:hypothetical protein